MKNEITIGRVKGEDWGMKKSLKVTVTIELEEKEKGVCLSIVGDVWNSKLTDLLQCGQIQDVLRDWLNRDMFKELYVSKQSLKMLLDVWDQWHLNDMRAGCIHQIRLMAEIKTEKGEDYFRVKDYNEVIEIPEFGKCPECGYKYGSAWQFEALPVHVIAFAEGFGN